MTMSAAECWWERQYDRLKSENAKLRERCAKTLEVGTRWMAKAARFESENTKLRELVADLIKWCDGPCGGCIDYESCDGVPIFEFWTTTKERARELGVEAYE